MLIAAWSTKGGSGLTVAAASLAISLTSRADGPAGREVLLVDLAGDLPAVLGVAEPTAGVTDWLAAGSQAPVGSLIDLEVEVSPSLRLLGCGHSHRWTSGRASTLVSLLTDDPRTVVVDLGVLPSAEPNGAAIAGSSPSSRLRRELAIAAPNSLLVIRACYVALHHAVRMDLRPTGVLLIREPGRSLDRYDVERLVEAPVVAEVDVDPAVARVVDAGLLAKRPPRPLTRALRKVA